MRSLILASVTNRRITIFLVIALVIAGFASYYIMPRQENPDLKPSIALVTAVYPGAIPADVEKLVTKKIEDAASEIINFESVESFSKNSASIVTVRIDANADRDKTWTDLRQKIDDIVPELPEGCWKPQIFTNLGETAGMILAISGSNYNYDQLEAFAERFKERLVEVDGVRRFDIAGKIDREVVVEIESERLNSYQLSFEDVFRILAAQNIEIPSGAIKFPQGRVNVNVPGIFESINDIENAIVDVSPMNGSVARIKDFAKVEMRLKDDAVKTRHNGKDAILLSGYFQEDRNVVIIGKTVREILEEVKSTLPPDLEVSEVLYQPDDVKEAVSGFMMNLLQGMLFVIIVVFLGMGLRNAAIVATAIPLSVLISFIVMALTGIQIHQISTTALIISLGMLVDNAIVISDAIQYRIDNGIDNINASVDGALESAVPVFTATLTTVAAFTPLLFLPGQIGQYVIAVPQLVMISLTASYFVAMFVTPALASILFVPDKSAGSKKDSMIKRVFAYLLNKGLLHRWKTAGLSFLIFFAVMILGFMFLQLRFFPNTDKNIVYIDIVSEMTDIDKTDAITTEIEKIVSSQPEVLQYTTSVGDDIPKFYIAMMPKAPSVDYSQIMMRVDLKKGGRFRSKEDFAFDLQKVLNSKVSGGKIKVKVPQQAEPMAAPVIFRVNGENPEHIAKVVNDLEKEISEIEGTVDVRNNSLKDAYEFSVDIDPDSVSSLGILKYDVQRQVNIALKGASPTVYRKAGKEFDITIKSNISSKEDLENLAVKSSLGGHKALLKEFAGIKLERRTVQINRYNRKLSTAVLADVIPGYGAPHISINAQRNIIPKIDKLSTSIDEDGELNNIVKNFGYLGLASLVALLIIYIILVIEFNSIVQPVIILLTVPLSLIGSALGLMIFNQPFSFTAFLGISSLIGIVVNNAILIIEFLNMYRSKEKDIVTASKTAVSRRFRPIMLSTVTTVMGLVPLVISGSTLFEPMSVSLISGLLVSTLLTLIVVPVVFVIIEGEKPLS